MLTAAIEEGVEAVICLSTDKAAYPINSMGKSKSLEESVAIAKSRYSGKTKIYTGVVNKMVWRKDV